MTARELSYQAPVHADGSSVEFLEFATRLLLMTRPYSVVEAGTFEGAFAVLAALTMRFQERPGKVWTADVKDFGAAALAEKNGVTDLLHLYLGDFAEMLAKHHSHESVDLALIDSGPTFGVETAPDVRWAHFQAVLPYMKRGGLIIVDDTQPGADWAHVSDIRARGVTLLGSRGCTLVQA